MSREQKIRRQLAIRRQLTSVLDVSSRRFVLWRPPADPEITTLPCEQLCDGQHQECPQTLGRRLQGSHRIRHTSDSTKIAPALKSLIEHGSASDRRNVAAILRQVGWGGSANFRSRSPPLVDVWLPEFHHSHGCHPKECQDHSYKGCQEGVWQASHALAGGCALLL